MIEKKRDLIVLTFLAIIVFGVFLLRLWQLQILKGDYYRRQSENNRVREVKISAPRGIIFDRNGIALVKNAPYFIASLIPDLSGRAINISELSEFLNVTVAELSERIVKHKKNSLEPVRLKVGLNFEEVAKIEARRSDFHGLIVETEITREYPYGSTGAHLIGYLGLPSDEQIRSGLVKGVPKDIFIGQWGVESLYDEKLRGIPGKKFIEVDALGRELRTLKIVNPQKGGDLILSVDIMVQKVAEEAFNGRAGALMAVDPFNGEVLAMVSLPSFDPNLFARGISPDQWEMLQVHPGHPFINRVFQSQYPPGSIFKIITAIAALEEGIINQRYSVNCSGEIKVGIWSFKCWKKGGHGEVDLKKAIVESCDIYFYEVGKQLGIDRIAKYARVLGFERKTGVNICSERTGFIPDTSWKLKKKGIPWYLGETFNAAIGQGYVSVTPAQAALMISAVANGGEIFQPVLLRGYDNPEPMAKLSLSPQTLPVIRDSLVDVVQSSKGTGQSARSDIVKIAGKTGTAQVIKESDTERGKNLSTIREDHAWFVAYAPAEYPIIALAVFVEHGGHGGGAAAPIAKVAIEEYIKSSGHHEKKDNHYN